MDIKPSRPNLLKPSSPCSDKPTHVDSSTVWDNPRFRHDVVPTAHLSGDVVMDVESARGHVSRANFHLDWIDLYEASAAFVRGWAERKDERRER